MTKTKTKLTVGDAALDFDPTQHATAEEAAKGFAEALRKLGYTVDLVPPDSGVPKYEQHWEVLSEDPEDAWGVEMQDQFTHPEWHIAFTADGWGLQFQSDTIEDRAARNAAAHRALDAKAREPWDRVEAKRLAKKAERAA